MHALRRNNQLCNRECCDADRFHAINIVVHVLNTLAVYVTALQVARVDHIAAAAAATLFAVHSVHVESVCTIYGRADMVAALFQVMPHTLSACDNRMNE